MANLNQKTLSTDELYELLEAKYSGREYVFFTDVPDSTGGGNRRADAIAMNMYQSRGLVMHGFEIKISRTDWLKELKQPEKAENIFRYCDYWWLVVGDESIVKADELPITWGLQIPYKDGLKIRKQAPKLEPTELNRVFLSVLMRKFNEMRSIKFLTQNDVEDAIQKAKIQWDIEADYKISDYTNLRDTVEEFEKASGLNIRHTMDIKDLGAIVKFVKEGKWKKENHLRTLNHMGETAKRLSKSINDEIKNLNEMMETENGK